MVGFAIVDNDAAIEASQQKSSVAVQTILDVKAERVCGRAVKKIELLMNDLGTNDRRSDLACPKEKGRNRWASLGP